MMKTESNLLQKDNKGLFSEDFSKEISRTMKSHEQAKELLASNLFKKAHGITQLFSPRTAKPK